MVIVIDLSREMVGFNLFQSFFYKLKSEGTLVFANNPLRVDDTDINYAALKSHVQNILFDHQASSYSLCVLYNMGDQRFDPICNSIAANIHEIKENIIKPLQEDYSLNRLYYFSLDNIKRNYDGIPDNKNIKLAIDFDSKGYITGEIESQYSDILFTEEEIRNLDLAWYDIRNNSMSSDNIAIKDSKKVAANFRNALSKFFDVKTTLINEKYKNLMWYAGRLDKVFKTVYSSFEASLYKNANSINSIQNPSEILRNALKMEVSTYRERETIIIHIALTDKNTKLHHEVLRYRHQLEIIALLIYLATNDTRLVFEGGQTIGRENHWEISTILDNDNLSKMLNSYNSKLKTELDKLGKFTNNEIEYEEFSPKTFNLAMEMKKPELPPMPSFGLFSNKRDIRDMERFAESLYERYLKGVNYANKRIRELTTKLRVQKESESSGKYKKGNILEISAELEKMQNSIKELQQKIAFYRPKEVVAVDPNLKLEYADIIKEIHIMMTKRLKGNTFFKNILLTLGVSLCTYPILQLSDIPDNTMLIISLLMLILPVSIYVILQIAFSALFKKKIIKKILTFRKQNEDLVNNLFRNDNEASKYVQDTYNLIMQRKYVNECNAKVIASNRKFKQFNYHHDKLKEHAEVSDKLIELLGINTSVSELVKIDKLEGVEGGKTVETNPLYCPLSYLLIADPIKNKAIINDQQNVDIDSNLIGFVEKFIIKHDKEYRND
jgi:hypothetical protein